MNAGYAQQQPVQSQAPQAAPAAQQPAPAPQPTGPPPGAKRPPRGRRDLSQLPVEHVEIDESVVEQKLFSPAALGIMAGMLAIGLIFGTFGSKASQARSVYDAQTKAANTVREDVKPFVETAQKVADKATKLDPTKPQYDVIKALADEKFVPPPSLMGGNAAFIGGDNVYNVTQFAAKATTFKQLLDRHNYETKIDKEELDQLLEGNELLQGNKKFAVLYNHKQLLEHLKGKSDDKDFKPGAGRLVMLEKFETDEEGNVTYESLANKSEGQINVKNIIPIEKSEMIKTGGQNALQRYKRRVEVIRFYAADLKKSTSGLVEGLSAVADRGGAPLIQLSVPEAPAGEAAGGAAAPPAKE